MHPLENAYLSAELPDGPIVVICRFRDDVGPLVPQNPAVHFQITLDKTKVSPSGKFIRLGDTQGDEVIGWQLRSNILVCEVLGQKKGDMVVPLPALVEQPKVADGGA